MYKRPTPNPSLQREGGTQIECIYNAISLSFVVVRNADPPSMRMVRSFLVGGESSPFFLGRQE